MASCLKLTSNGNMMLSDTSGCLLLSGVVGSGENIIQPPFGVAVTDRTTGVIYNIDKPITAGLNVIITLYTHRLGEYIFPPYTAFHGPVLETPAGNIRIYVDNGVFGYEMDTGGGSSDPVNNQTILRDDLHELGTPVGWVFGDALEWQKKF